MTLLRGIGEPGCGDDATIGLEMANEKRSSKKTGGGRVTPKKSAQTDVSPGTPSGSPGASTRYTPPTPRSQTVSARWVPIVMLILFGLGLLIIFLHYVDLLIPGAASNWWLLGGLGCILAGIITATQYR
ncbi:Cell division protein CrgA [Acidimicrobiia bacterium]